MNFRAQLLILSVIFLFCECGKREEEDMEIPPYILSPGKLSKVIVDFALAESSANMNIKNVPVQKIDSVYAFNPLVENGVRKSQYDSALFFYSGHPELYKQVYDSALVFLSEYKAMRNAVGTETLVK